MMPAIRQHGVSFLVESGNANNAELEKQFHAASQLPAFEGCLRSISFISKNSCRAIQLADLLAFYTRRQMRNADRFDYKMVLPPCPYIQTIRRHVPLWQMGSTGNAQQMPGNLKTISGLDEIRRLMDDA